MLSHHPYITLPHPACVHPPFPALFTTPSSLYFPAIYTIHHNISTAALTTSYLSHCVQYMHSTTSQPSLPVALTPTILTNIHHNHLQPPPANGTIHQHLGTHLHFYIITHLGMSVHFISASSLFISTSTCASSFIVTTWHHLVSFDNITEHHWTFTQCTTMPTIYLCFQLYINHSKSSDVIQ
jgi:hypothetical protein